jgi:hypothetical protein
MEGSPGLPLAILIIGASLWATLTLVMLPRIRGFGLVLFLALSARYLATFFHDYTTRSLVAGQSLNSFVTLLLTAFLLVICSRDLLRFRLVLPVYLFIGALLLSGIWNLEVAGTINAVIRQCLFLGMMLLVTTAIDSEPKDGSVSKAALAAFIIPLFYQLVSVVLRLGKASESDGSVSYIGGYVHEGVFSIMLLTALVFVSITAGMSWRKRTFYMSLIFVALIFANYRTAVVSALPLLLTNLVFGSATQVRSSLANYVRSAALLGTICMGILLAILLSQRMADIGTILSSGGILIKPPSEFASDDRGLLSGRLLIWSDYIYTTIRSDMSHLMFGFGPDSWQKTFSLYAHNVYVSYVYEIGVIGLLIYCYLLLHFAWLAFRARRDKRWQLVGAHCSYAILGLGTMPTFTIEGVILYAVICGYTVYYYLSERVPTRFIIPSNFRGPKLSGRYR